jgi:aspartyl-tRNA(Asn)/glutamyl-tRNA(Gln) amidotransferase subunit A
MKKSELPFLSATELSKLMKAKKVSPVEATEAYLERIDKVNPKVHAYITVTGDIAMKEARQAEKEITRGDWRGPMHGVPYAMKDQIWTKGIRTTNASDVLKDFVPDDDATAVTKLREAGAVMLGKLNLAEFAGGGIFKFPYGQPRNPWNLEHTTGGSSTGSGAATAAYLCATSLGEDTGGSIRSPASFCGLVGLRPTWSRISQHGLFNSAWSMDTIGPISRTVEDCAMTLEAIAGHDPKDPYSSNQPVPAYSKQLNGKIKGTRVGVVKELVYDESIEPVVRKGVLGAAKKLEDLGCDVEEVSVPTLDAGHSYLIQMAFNPAEVSSLYRQHILNQLDDFNYDVQVRLLLGAIWPAQWYYKGQRLREQLRTQVLSAFERYDVLIGATDTCTAPKIVPGKMPGSKEKMKESVRSPVFQTVGFALASVPAMSVPCGFTGDGPGALPLAFQMGGRPFGESTMLNVAYAYEQAMGWYKRRAPI